MNNFSIITENDESPWQDEKGAIYHFPKRYLKYLNSNTKIIYYKGRIKNSKFQSERLSKEPHYFGIGTIGDVWAEEDTSNFFAEIVDYSEFKTPIHFKNSDGEYLELIPANLKANYWRNGVRPISKKNYKSILKNLDKSTFEKNKRPKQYVSFKEQQIDLVLDGLLGTRKKNQMLLRDSSNKVRHSKQSKKIGDKGEMIVMKYLKNLNKITKKDTIIWHANIGETPGYDISYIDNINQKICIEVKATSGRKFSNFIMTSNEVKAAEKIGENYKIFLVANCFGSNPRIQVIENPKKSDVYAFETIAYKVYKQE